VPLLAARDLTKIYGGKSAAPVVDRVSFSIERGQTLGLVGESGSGKSTIARIVLGLVEPTSGSVSFDGHPVTGVPQNQLRPSAAACSPSFRTPTPPSIPACASSKSSPSRS
jgi:peptide/nickel transport system ATP-binding protein